MFTGIIEKVSRINKISKNAISVENLFDIKELKIGESISVNGVCLTLTHFSKKEIYFDISPETFKRTAFSFSKYKDPVNLERALKPSDRMGGHFVSGHVDGLARILSIKKTDSFYIFKIKALCEGPLAEKGSVALNGISLTCYNVKDFSFEVSVVPHTFENTALKFMKKGDFLNIEFDLLAKYSESKNKKKITFSFLKENGFLD
ncbi:MAG: riboflavin synthase [Elusimicrobia bacterium]|nr:riboflavin synthase [Elusimicrobiota bacterium]